MAEAYLALVTISIVDDTNTVPARQATVDVAARHLGRYRVLLGQSTRNNCHPTLWNGLMLLQRTG